MNDMNLDDATVAAEAIMAWEIAKKKDGLTDEIKIRYWDACDFEGAYNEFNQEEVYAIHEYYFEDLLEIAWQVSQQKPMSKD